MYNVSGNSESETKLASAIGHRCLVQNGKVRKSFVLKSNPCGAVCCMECASSAKELKPRKFRVSHAWIFHEKTPAALVPLKYRCAKCGLMASLALENPETIVHRLCTDEDSTLDQ